MEKEVVRVVQYFSLFNYPPTFEEIYTFLPKKTSKASLKKALSNLERGKKIKKIGIRYFPPGTDVVLAQALNMGSKYTLGEYSIKKNKSSKLKINNETIKQLSNFKNRYLISKNKLKNWRFRLYLRLLSFFPQIKLVGLSGSVAMMNAKEEDDIDLFIITAKNRLFMGRFIALVLAQVLGIRRKREHINQKGRIDHLTSVNIGSRRNSDKSENSNLSGLSDVSRIFPNFSDKVCLNLFFDECNLAVPDFKKTEYVAHEILQMKPIINKNQTHEKFLRANQWVYRLFPNAKRYSIFSTKGGSASDGDIRYSEKNNKKIPIIFNIQYLISDWLELLLKKLQLYFINRHRTSEIVTNSQLWFHPEDFGSKIYGLTRMGTRIYAKKGGCRKTQKANKRE